MLAQSVESIVIWIGVFVLFACFGVYYALMRAWKKIDALEERIEKIEKRSVPGSYLDAPEENEDE